MLKVIYQNVIIVNFILFFGILLLKKLMLKEDRERLRKCREKDWNNNIDNMKELRVQSDECLHGMIDNSLNFLEKAKKIKEDNMLIFFVISIIIMFIPLLHLLQLYSYISEVVIIYKEKY